MKLSKKKHLILFLVCISAWLFFYIVGIPSNYFLDWKLSEKILLSFITFFAIIPLIGFFLMAFMNEDFLKIGLWTAFYASIPLFALDFTIEGLIKGEGLYYLISHWYLSIAYIYVWIEFPLLGIALKKLLKNSNTCS